MTDTEGVRRYKEDAELDGDEHLARVQARRRGEPEPQFERDEYRTARREALESAGLEPEDDPAGEAVDEPMIVPATPGLIPEHEGEEDGH